MIPVYHYLILMLIRRLKYYFKLLYFTDLFTIFSIIISTSEIIIMVTTIIDPTIP